MNLKGVGGINIDFGLDKGHGVFKTKLMRGCWVKELFNGVDVANDK